MDKNKFWNIIDKVRNDSNNDCEIISENLKKELTNLSAEELIHFQFIYFIYELTVISIPDNLIWTALILINGGYCTDIYAFAGWLIMQGKKVYMEALADADTLAEIDAQKDKCKYSDFHTIVNQVFLKKTGLKRKDQKKMNIDFWSKPEAKKEEKEIKKEIVFSKVKRNRDWDIPDMKNILPNLYKKYQQS